MAKETSDLQTKAVKNQPVSSRMFPSSQRSPAGFTEEALGGKNFVGKKKP